MEVTITKRVVYLVLLGECVSRLHEQDEVPLEARYCYDLGLPSRLAP